MSSSPAAKRAESRQPWVTCGLLVLCAVASLYSNRLEKQVLSSADAAVSRAAAYWTERPYLEPADIIVEQLTIEAVQSRRAEFARERSGRGSIGVPMAVRTHYQEILDGLTEEAIQPLSKLPRYEMGVRASKPSGVSYLSHAFLHEGWLHLIGSGIFLFFLGAGIERVWGHALFGVFALASSVAAATGFRIGAAELDAALIGASGMIAGLLAAFVLRFAPPRAEASYWPVLVGALCWLTLPAVFGWHGSIVPGPTADVELSALQRASFWSVGGGLVFGFAITAVMMLGKIESALFDTDAAPVKQPSVDPDLAAALDARANGQSAEAFELISALLERKPEHRAALLAMWEVALELGRHSDASRAMLRVVRDEVRRNASSAVDHWLDLTRRGLHGEAEPALLIHIALMLCEAGHRVEALGALKTALEISVHSDAPEIAARVARASRSLDRGFTEAAAWHALGSMDLSFRDRQNLENLLAELQQEESESPAQAEASDRGVAATSLDPSSSHPEPGSRIDDRPLGWEAPGLSEGAESPHATATRPDAGAGVGAGAAEPAAAPRPVPIELEISSREIRVVRAQPSELTEDGLLLEIEGGEKRKIGFERIDAISVVAVEGLASKFVILVDLVLNWMSEPPEPYRVIRLRGDRFDPRRFSPGHDSPLDAMRVFTTRLLQRADATALPDTRSVQGAPFASFADLASYHRTIFAVEEEAAEADPVA